MSIPESIARDLADLEAIIYDPSVVARTLVGDMPLPLRAAQLRVMSWVRNAPADEQATVLAWATGIKDRWLAAASGRGASA